MYPVDFLLKNEPVFLDIPQVIIKLEDPITYIEIDREAPFQNARTSTFQYNAHRKKKHGMGCC